MELLEIGEHKGFKQYGIILSDRPYVIVKDLKTGEFTASTKVNNKTIYILDYGEGVGTLEEAKEAVMAYHRKVLS